MAPQAGQPIPGWSAGAQGVKGCSTGPGEEEATLLCTTCELEKPMPGAEGLCQKEPTVPTPATVTPVHRALFYMALK